MPGPRTISSTNINPRPCTDVQTEQNWNEVKRQLGNISLNLGDVDQFFNGPRPAVPGSGGNPGGGITDILQDVEYRLEVLEGSGGGGGGGGVSAYGGLLLTTSFEKAMASGGTNYSGIVEFDVSQPSLVITPTAGSSALLTVHSGGDYYISFGLSGFEEADSIVSRRLRMAAIIYKNGSATSLLDVATGSTVFTSETANSGGYIYAGGAGVLTLSASDTIQLRYIVTRHANYLTFTVGTPGNVAEGAAGANSRAQFDYGHLNVIKLA